MFINEAIAQTAPAAPSAPAQAGQTFDPMAFLPLVLIFVVFYFFMIRPQQKKMKQHRELLSNIKRGDRVLTSGGIIGVVQKVTDTELEIEIADGVKVKVLRATISDVMSKTEVSAPNTTSSATVSKTSSKSANTSATAKAGKAVKK